MQGLSFIFFSAGMTRPTKSGVRLPVKHMTDLKTAIEAAETKVEKVQEQSSEIMSKCYYALIRKEIELLHSLQKPFCEGSKIMHSSHRASRN